MSALTRWIVCVWVALAAAVMLVSLAGCGGGGGAAAVDPVPATITAQPGDTTVAAGAGATFSVSASGDALTYRWQSSTDGTTWSDVAGATSASYTLTAASAADNGKHYRVIVGNAAGNQTSRAALLTVTTTPGGGGNAGIPDTCRPVFALPAGTTIETTASTSTGSAPLTGSISVVVPASFEGQAATEVAITTSFPPLALRSFATYDAAAGGLTIYGVLGHSSSADADTFADFKAVATPPTLDTRYALQAGQSVTVNASDVQTLTTTINGVAQPPQTTTESTTSTIQFVGMETLTIPAGTFHACKYIVSGTGVVAGTNWVLAGYGVDLKSITSSVTTTTTAIRVNGQALTHFP